MKTTWNCERILAAMKLADTLADKAVLAVLFGSNERVNRYAGAAKRARQAWQTIVRPLPLP